MTTSVANDFSLMNCLDTDRFGSHRRGTELSNSYLTNAHHAVQM